MSHEFRLHHYVSELMSNLGVHTSGGPGAETYTDLLQKNMTPYISTQISAHSAKLKIAECSHHPDFFLSKYDELKAQNSHILDSVVFLLSKLCDEPVIKGFLKRKITGSGPSSVALTTSFGNTSGTSHVGGMTAEKMTQEELEEIKARLMKVTAESVATSSEIARKTLRDNQVKRTADLPVQPEWLYHRAYLTMDFVADVDHSDAYVVPIGSLPLHLQEYAIMDDLLYLMEGVEGKYIQPVLLADRFAAREFRIDAALDPSLRELIKRILPLCSNYSSVVRFIEEKSAFEYGLINHALAAAYQSLIKDYKVLVAQLEYQHNKGHLTLQKLWFYIQPTMRVMEILGSVAIAVNKGNFIGGSVLSMLHERTSTFIGDSKGQELCLFLTQCACVPYFEMLEKWIYKGIISDPYGEFLVEQNNAFQKEKLQEDYNDSYWEQHYTICEKRIPVFLETVADKILNTGKYLNVVRQCGHDIKCPDAQEIIYTIKERQYFECIEKAYRYASKLLLHLLMEEKDLMARLRSVKHYFLLDQGDFIVQFMDMADDEMKKKMDDIMQTRLESLLELALRTSTANIDPYKDDLRVNLLPYDLVTQMFKILTIETKLEKDYKVVDPTDLNLSCLEAFTFDYIVKWPVSLVISRKALTKYQMLFRHLFYCKHVERQLCNVWLSNKVAKLFALKSTRWYAAAFALRQRMLNFVQNFQYYMMFEVIEPCWQSLENNMMNVSNLDDVLAHHTDFLNTCLKDCMLTSSELLKIVHKLMMVCVTFSNFMQRQSADLELGIDSRASGSMVQSAHTGKETVDGRTAAKVLLTYFNEGADNENFERTISTFDTNFSRLLVELLDKILEFSVSNCEHRLVNILYRLDFNNYYTKQLEFSSAEKANNGAEIDDIGES